MDVRRLDFPEAELFISAEGDWRGFRSNACAKEPETAEWIRRVARPRSVFYDVGACVGSYSLVAAALGASVHAFEPVAANYSQLQTNVWINELPQVTPWPVACTDRTASMQIKLSSLAPGAASHDVQQSRTGFSDTGAHVQNAIGMGIDRFVDEFQISPPTDMKIDVDGGEVEVLQGSRRALGGVQSVMVEASAESEPSILAILHKAGLQRTGSWPRSGRQSNHLFERGS